MTDIKTNYKKLTPEEREAFVKNLTETYELLNLQAHIAEARSRIKKAELEGLICTIKLEEYKTPPKDAKN